LPKEIRHDTVREDTRDVGQLWSTQVEKKTLREWRVTRGKTQQQLANEAGVSLSTVTDAEAGRKTPHLRNAEKLAKALGVELGDIKWTNADE
jgi:DNA-binding XRE family transcriptional regulator